MKKSTTALAAVLVLGLTAAAPFLAASFASAPSGVALPFDVVNLPPVKVSALRPLPTTPVGGPLGPTVEQLLNGNRIVTSDAQMQAIWSATLTGPYDPALFDFSTSFVVWMGGGAMQLGSHGISAVERADAEWSDPMSFGGPGTQPDPFLAVTSTTFFPGAFPQDPPPPTYRVSAVRVANEHLDDAVFHRAYVFAP
jgi:hypothetical protein